MKNEETKKELTLEACLEENKRLREIIAVYAKNDPERLVSAMAEQVIDNLTGEELNSLFELIKTKNGN